MLDKVLLNKLFKNDLHQVLSELRDGYSNQQIFKYTANFSDETYLVVTIATITITLNTIWKTNICSITLNVAKYKISPQKCKIFCHSGKNLPNLITLVKIVPDDQRTKTLKTIFMIDRGGGNLQLQQSEF